MNLSAMDREGVMFLLFSYPVSDLLQDFDLPLFILGILSGVTRQFLSIKLEEFLVFLWKAEEIDTGIFL